MNNEELCPCKSGKPYGECCGPIHSGAVKAATAEALMRARYSAYVAGAVDFLGESSAAPLREVFNPEEAKAWSDAAEWHGLEILGTEAGGPEDERGVVEFRALYTANGEFCNHHEKSSFVRENGDWKFEDGEMLKEKPVVREEAKVGRNDPCPCGSGKKYKKCCGKGL